MQLKLERLYLKDSSFEAPNTPMIFTKQWKPEMHLELHTNSNPLGEDGELTRYEVVLTVTVKATVEETTAFIAEVQQAGVFALSGLEQPALRQALATFCPNVLFPYIRETVDNLCLKGSFPAVQLQPVNFDVLFAEAERRAAEEGQTGAAPTH